MTINVKAREINWISVLERSASTMIQTFMAGWVVLDASSMKTAGLSAVAAGLSVLKNAVKEWHSKTEKV
tara:strand:+ start:1177 stop:1383 length:207 start_codon:yes stop_codon:yes gene_type:complete